MRKINNFKEKLIIIPVFALMYAVLYLADTTCIVRMISGIPCPFCGMTRAVLSILRFDIAAAFAFHPMVWSLPVLALYYLYDGRPIKNRWINISVLSLVLGGFLAVWILRLCGVLTVI